MVNNTFTRLLGCNASLFDRRGVLRSSSDIVELFLPGGRIGCNSYPAMLMRIFRVCCGGERPEGSCERSTQVRYPVSVVVHLLRVKARNKGLALLREITLESELTGPVLDDDAEFPLPEAMLDCYGDVVFWQDIVDYLTYSLVEALVVEENSPC